MCDDTMYFSFLSLCIYKYTHKYAYKNIYEFCIVEVLHYKFE